MRCNAAAEGAMRRARGLVPAHAPAVAMGVAERRQTRIGARQLPLTRDRAHECRIPAADFQWRGQRPCLRTTSGRDGREQQGGEPNTLPRASRSHADSPDEANSSGPRADLRSRSSSVVGVRAVAALIRRRANLVTTAASRNAISRSRGSANHCQSRRSRNPLCRRGAGRLRSKGASRVGRVTSAAAAPSLASSAVDAAAVAAVGAAAVGAAAVGAAVTPAGDAGAGVASCAFAAGGTASAARSAVARATDRKLRI